MRVTIVGAGNLGGSVAVGLLASGSVAPESLRCVTRTAEGAERLRERLQHETGERSGAVTVTTDAVAAVAGADVVMLGVKPHATLGLIRTLGPALEEGTTVVSLAAGVALADLVAAAPEGARVVRLMTNTPVAVRAAVSLVAAAEGTDDAALAQVVALADALGATHVLDEAHFDAATALAGSGPAYVFLLAELLRDAGVGLGLDTDEALAMTRGMIEGAARLLAASHDDPAALRRAVTSPGGMTAAAIAVLEDAGLRGSVADALAAAVARAAELSGPPAG